MLCAHGRGTHAASRRPGASSRRSRRSSCGGRARRVTRRPGGGRCCRLPTSGGARATSRPVSGVCCCGSATRHQSDGEARASGTSWLFGWPLGCPRGIGSGNGHTFPVSARDNPSRRRPAHVRTTDYARGGHPAQTQNTSARDQKPCPRAPLPHQRRARANGKGAPHARAQARHTTRTHTHTHTNTSDAPAPAALNGGFTGPLLDRL